MLLTLALLTFSSLTSAYNVTPVPPPYGYETKWYSGMPVDHFAFTDNRTFDMRYLINDTYFTPGGPIFFYCGNEGAIETFAQNTGFMWDIAPIFNALILFAEHRFYGETQPFGNANDSYRIYDNRGYLTTEQALADYAVFLRWFKQENYTEAKTSKVIAFGGSYGGMLAAWMRMKYPHIITGSLAASAPILQFTGVTDCATYSSIVTRTFKNSGDHCDECIKKSWPIIHEFANNTDGREKLNEIFHLCQNSTINNTDDGYKLVYWLEAIWENLAEVDYPYAANFLNPVPAWPVQAACKFLTNSTAADEDLLEAIYNAASVFMNYTGDIFCYNFDDANAALGIGALGWDFQSCTEMVMPMCNNASSMFEESQWDFQEFSDNCFNKAGVRPREYWAETEYGADKIQAASNIIFSNGYLDPWSGGGVTESIPGANSLHPLYIQKAAHHYDIRGGNPEDTSEILQARQTEIDIIKGWLATSHNNHTTTPKNKSWSLKSSNLLWLSAVILLIVKFFP